MRFPTHRFPGAALVSAGFLMAGLALPAIAAQASPSESTAVVHPDGSIETRCKIARPPAANADWKNVRYDFGLPRQPARSQGMDDGTLPICQTVWEKAGIRYTQMVLMTRLEEGDLPTAASSPADAVLMVQLIGDNYTNTYTEATADLSVTLDGRPVNLELREGLAYATGTKAPWLVAAIEVSGSGIAGTNGPKLCFAGSMPPGTSGAMTLKFPIIPLTRPVDIECLQDLEFDKELKRVKRFWTGRSEGGKPPVKLLPSAW